MKTVNVYEDKEGDYALEFNGQFYGFSFTGRKEAAEQLARGVEFIPYDQPLIDFLELKWVDKYKFEDY